jgi:hypothetical protein
MTAATARSVSSEEERPKSPAKQQEVIIDKKEGSLVEEEKVQ